jgi:hypothetical protein
VNALAVNFGITCQAAAETNIQTTSAHQKPDSTTKLDDAELTLQDGLFVLDYQDIQLPDNEEIDLLGFHILKPVNEWLYLGVGGYAPVSKGEYGGFMAFDVLLHAQRKVSGNLFVNGGLSFGGGGGGKSVSQSVQLSGTGGFARGYLGFGYEFENFSAGVNISRMKFFESSIDGTQLNLFVQKPFSYRTGSYSNSGKKFIVPRASSSGEGSGDAPESIISMGLDNYSQIDPAGSYQGNIHTVDLQFSHFLTKETYWFFAFGVGYEGLPLYNQVIGGIGARIAISPRVNLYGQVGIGSGGYAPSIIDTGSGLLVYPKVSVEYMLNNNWGLGLTSGYLLAPDGSSENLTFGATLNYHFRAQDKATGANYPVEGKYVGYRFSISHETKFNMSVNGAARENLNQVAIQTDRIVNDNFYVPIRASISYEAYRGYPGYGEVLMGVGLQNKYDEANPFQYFGELQVGANVEGALLRAGIGLNYELNEVYALRGQISQTYGANGFRAAGVELGLTYRFSLPAF